MGWTNAAVQQMFTDYPDRICFIGLNNGKRIFIGYNTAESVQPEDISFDTIGGVDVMKITHRSSKQTEYIEWENFITTEFIESIEVMKEEYKNYRIDPFILNA